MELKAPIASESTHWYSRDGSPAYTVIGKNGKERATTLRDARALDLVPSVTTVIRMAAAPGLERWKNTQILLASLTLPKQDGESLDDYADRVIRDSQEQGRKAMDLGTAIHGSLEKAYLGLPYDPEHATYVHAVMSVLEAEYGTREWFAEKSFASEHGYGGKIDLCALNLVIDFKTKAFGPDDKVVGYDEHMMQLAAYGNGIFVEDFEAANVFVSTTYPGLVKVVKWGWHDLYRGWQMFQSLLDFWKLKNKV